MPTYCFKCPTCDKSFEILCSYSDSLNIKCDTCQTEAVRQLTTCCVKFSEPKSTSKWDNFSYRAGYNLEKAKQERRDAEAREGNPNPYKDTDDSNRPGVFGPGGIDNI